MKADEYKWLPCSTGTFQLWGHTIQVDWAEPEKDVDEEVMQRVRVLYVSVKVCVWSWKPSETSIPGEET